ncbi:hypothetical protein Ddye_021070 [Dipteronia dyeriana]|uniref:Auxin-responsive protein n=1 Tax=Dipteronia dyeriana TaxID=168575 RepID=A0AAD9U0X3_9ROSI|nr:hypothetical protein Ddye_021070 [Dipteronia dyeriana]
MTYMELQLGLALPNHAISVKGFDLNTYLYEPKDIIASNNPSWNTLGFVFLPTTTTTNNDAKKRSFDEASHQVRSVPQTLPLLHWPNQPNDEDDHPKDLDSNSSFSTNKIGEEDGVVGWPPIKNLRKKHRQQHHHHEGRRATAAKNNQTVENGFVCGGRQYSNSMLVKVNMEGVAITRKIDLTLHDSFQSLNTTMITMFGLWNQDSSSYKLTYQDNEGDWLTADQDVPWRTFIRTVQRLKLLKSSD